MGLMVPDDVRRADFASGFGLDTATGTDIHGTYRTKPITAGKSRDVVWKPRALGVLAMESYLPVSMVPGGVMVLELTWASDGKAACNTSSPYGFLHNVSNLVVNVDVLTIDPTFLTSISQHLFGGNALQMQFQNYHTSFYSLLSAAVQLTHSRAASRLNSALVTFAIPDADTGATKTQNDLRLPVDQELKARITIGEKRFPATEDTKGASLFYRRLMQAMDDKPPNISRHKFETDSFIAAFDLESAPHVQQTMPP